MRPRPTLTLTRLLGLFFWRRLAHSAVLRSPLARVGALGLLAAYWAISVAVGYAFLKPMVGDERVWTLLLGVSTVSVVLWTLGAFLLVKTLFLNADGLQRHTYQMPLTNKERAVAFLAFEAVAVLTLAMFGFLSMAVVALLLVGPQIVAPLLAAVVFPAILTYLIVTVVYLALERLLVSVRLGAVRKPILLLLIFVLLALYGLQMQELTLRVSDSYLDGEPVFVWVSFLTWILDHAGLAVMLLTMVGLSAATLVSAVALTPNHPQPTARYVRLPLGVSSSRTSGAYFACLARSTQTWITGILALALFVYLLGSGSANPVWGLSLLGIGGFYLYGNTESIRRLQLRSRCRPWMIYAQLVGVQLAALLMIGGLASLLVILLSDATLASCGLALAAAVSSVIIATLVGIVFPASDDNPFSLLVGMIIVSVLLATVVVALGVLQMPPVTMVMALLAAHVLLVVYSIQGINASETRRRHAHVRIAHQ